MAVRTQAKRKNFVDVLKSLFLPYLSEGEELLKILNDDYSKEIAIAKQMEEHAEMIPFDFLKERLKKIAEEERRHAELLRQKIVELGGNVNPVPKFFSLKTESIHSEKGFRKLILDLEFDREIYEDYISQMNRIQNDEIRKLLRQIAVEEERHKDELMDLVMKLC